MRYSLMQMIRTFVVLILLLLVSAPASATRCTKPARVGPQPSDLLPPLEQFADDILTADLAAAHNMQEPIAAIAHLQKHQFDMHHPKAAKSNPAGYFRMRCASRQQYVALNDEISRRVNELAPGYRKQRRYLGKARQQIRLDDLNLASPGLLNLLLMSNQYQHFETEAQSFLRSAIGDSEADRHFTAVSGMAQRRLAHLKRWQQAYGSEYAAGSVGLLPAEVAGISQLQDFTSRVNPLRSAHAAHWLAQESASFKKIVAEEHDPANLLKMSFALQTAIGQLELAMQIALPEQRRSVTELAKQRGDTLMELERLQAAIEYYGIAGAESQREQAQAKLDAIGKERLGQVRKLAKRDILKMRKNKDETQAFEAETDALAEELGVDLDDF